MINIRSLYALHRLVCHLECLAASDNPKISAKAASSRNHLVSMLSYPGVTVETTVIAETFQFGLPDCSQLECIPHSYTIMRDDAGRPIIIAK